jgi:hypothetical protein
MPFGCSCKRGSLVDHLLKASFSLLFSALAYLTPPRPPSGPSAPNCSIQLAYKLAARAARRVPEGFGGSGVMVLRQWIILLRPSPLHAGTKRAGFTGLQV